MSRPGSRMDAAFAASEDQPREVYIETGVSELGTGSRATSTPSSA